MARFFGCPEKISVAMGVVANGLACLALTIFVSCRDGGIPRNPINPNVKLLKSYFSDNPRGNFRIGVWSNNDVYCLAPLRKLTVGSEFKVIKDELIRDFRYSLEPIPGYGYRYVHFLAINKKGTKILMVMSLYGDISLGDLVEMDLQSHSIRVLRDSTYNVSSALYWQGDSTCIYYSFGNFTRGTSPGYYAYNLRSGEDNNIILFNSPGETNEVIEGFDISPDGTKLLFPLNYARYPTLDEFNLVDHSIRILDLKFDHIFLWARYSPDGKRILYSNYSAGVGGSSTASGTEVGIVDMETMTKSVLDVNTNEYGSSVNVFPSWSPDGRAIIFGSAQGPEPTPSGAISPYSLYVLRNVQ